MVGVMRPDVSGQERWLHTGRRTSRWIFVGLVEDGSLVATKVLGGVTVANGIDRTPSGRQYVLHRQLDTASRCF